MAKSLSGRSCDIFCNVVDNYGDIGVCWRLARQLAAKHAVKVRLWVDDLASLQKICPEINSGLGAQFTHGVDVRHWPKYFPATDTADVVIEAFACDLPASYIAAMAAQKPAPVWINLEYLSAEDWVRGCHGLPSPHPSLPLLKYFYFPGFDPATGGVLAEKGLLEQRNAFQQNPAALAAFWQSLGVPLPRPDEIRVSLFSYENTAVPGLFEAWVSAGQPVLCLVPEGRVMNDVSAFFGQSEIVPGGAWRKGNLTIRVLPFVEQERYDYLLWACDCNFVRGEDSFVRAQWAARPFVWHIYPQEEGAHWKKLSAFLNVYLADLPQAAADDLRNFWEAWNRGVGAGTAWAGFWRHHAVLAAHAHRWAGRLSAQGDLASKFVHFCTNKL